MIALSETELAEGLSRLPAWNREGETLHRSIHLPSFMDAIALVNQVAALAEEADHHPDIQILWRTVRFSLTTHDAGGLTRRDLEMAARIDALTAPPPSEEGS